MDNETLTLIVVGLLVAPPIVFGIWLRIKLMGTEQGEAFLIDREVARIEGEDDARLLNDAMEERAGKAARMKTDADAMDGAYGQNVTDLLKKAVPFIFGYFFYAVVLIAVLVLWIV